MLILKVTDKNGFNSYHTTDAEENTEEMLENFIEEYFLKPRGLKPHQVIFTEVKFENDENTTDKFYYTVNPIPFETDFLEGTFTANIQDIHKDDKCIKVVFYYEDINTPITVHQATWAFNKLDSRFDFVDNSKKAAFEIRVPIFAFLKNPEKTFKL